MRRRQVGKKAKIGRHLFTFDVFGCRGTKIVKLSLYLQQYCAASRGVGGVYWALDPETVGIGPLPDRCLRCFGTERPLI